jgi:hypothetical protein
MCLVQAFPWAVQEKDQFGFYPVLNSVHTGKPQNMILEIIDIFPQAVTFSKVDKAELPY